MRSRNRPQRCFSDRVGRRVGFECGSGIIVRENFVDCTPVPSSDDCSGLAQPDTVSESLADETEPLLACGDLKKGAPERACPELFADDAAKPFAAHRLRCFASDQHHARASGRVSACDRDLTETVPDRCLRMGI